MGNGGKIFRATGEAPRLIGGRHGVCRMASLVFALRCLALPVDAIASIEGDDQSGSAGVSVEVLAQIKGRCGISGDTALLSQVPRIDQAVTLTFPFKIDCNAPFAIGASSLHGGLLKDDGDAAKSRGFAVLKQYQVSLSVETNDDVIRSQKCTSKQLSVDDRARGCEFFGIAPGQGLSSKQRIAIDRNGAVTVLWDSGDGENGRRLAAGHYRDTITVVVGVRT